MTSTETVLFDGTTVLKDIDTKLILEAPWNVNVMTPEIYKALLDDLRVGGPRNMDPVDVARLEDHKDQLYTINGAHRLRAAKELGWEQIPCIFHNDITKESEARLFNYRRDAERGEIDQFKLAETFQWYSSQEKKSQEEISRMFGVDRSTVSKRIALLQLDPVVKGVAQDQGLSISHLEPLTTIKPELQKHVIKELRDRGWSYSKGDVPSVRQIEREVKDIKQVDEQIQAFKKRVEAAKVKKCPTCGKPPRFVRWETNHFSCENGHTWMASTGKSPYQDSYSSNETRAQRAHKIPQHVKSSHKTDEYEAAMWPFLRELWSRIQDVDGCNLSGKLKDGSNFSLDYNGFHFSFDNGNKDPIEFAVEEITSKDWQKKGYYTRLKPQEVMRQGFITKKEQLTKLEQMTEKFLQDYGKTPRTRPVKYEAAGQTTSFIPAAMDKVSRVPRGTRKPKK